MAITKERFTIQIEVELVYASEGAKENSLAHLRKIISTFEAGANIRGLTHAIKFKGGDALLEGADTKQVRLFPTKDTK